MTITDLIGAKHVFEPFQNEANIWIKLFYALRNFGTGKSN